MRGPPADLSTALAEQGWELVTRAGEGASAVVWKARRGETLAALKIGVEALREAEIVARAGRRWGPPVLDAGRAAGEPFVALGWTEGTPLDPARITDRATLAS